MPPDIFFAGPGLDRADQLRELPERLAALTGAEDARQLAWEGGCRRSGPTAT